jgi:hypothetical protein
MTDVGAGTLVAGGDVLALAATVISSVVALIVGIVGSQTARREARYRRRTEVEIAAINATVARHTADQADAAARRQADLATITQMREGYVRLAADHRAEIDRLAKQLAAERTALRQSAERQSAQRARITALEATVRALEGRVAALEQALIAAGLEVPP